MINDALQYIENFFQWLFVDLIYGGILDSFASIIESLSMPEVVADIGGMASSVASGPMGWAWSVMQFGPGLTMVASAYSLRFILRRIPFIGG